MRPRRRYPNQGTLKSVSSLRFSLALVDPITDKVQVDCNTHSFDGSDHNMLLRPNVSSMVPLRLHRRIRQRCRLLVACSGHHHASSWAPNSQCSNLARLQAALSELVLDLALHRHCGSGYNIGNSVISVCPSGLQLHFGIFGDCISVVCSFAVGVGSRCCYGSEAPHGEGEKPVNGSG
jgi:hypothetical protein